MKFIVTLLLLCSAACADTLVISVAPPTPAGSFTAGNTSVLASVDNGNAMALQAFPVSIPQAAIVTSIASYCTTPGVSVLLGLYSDNNGYPGTLVAQTEAFTPVTGWNTQATITAVVIPAGTYWVAFLPGDNAFANPKAAVGSGSVDSAVTAFALPTTFPTGGSTSTSQWSVYVNLSTQCN